MLQLLTFIVLLAPSLSNAAAVWSRLECAARLEETAVDPGANYVNAVFTRFNREGWDSFQSVGMFAAMMPPRWSAHDDEIQTNEALSRHVHLMPWAGWRLSTAVERWKRAARHALIDSPRVRRRRVVGAPQISAVLAARAERGQVLQRQWEAAPEARPVSIRAPLKVIAGDVAVAASSFGALGALVARVPNLASLVDSPSGLLRAGVIALLVPVAAVTLERVFVHVTQALRTLNKWRANDAEAPTWVDDEDFRDGVAKMFVGEDRGAYLYRGTRTRIDLRRTDTFAIRPPLPSAGTVIAAAAAAKARPPAVDRRVVESDEIIFFDWDEGDWVLVGLDFAPAR